MLADNKRVNLQLKFVGIKSAGIAYRFELQQKINWWPVEIIKRRKNYKLKLSLAN